MPAMSRSKAAGWLKKLECGVDKEGDYRNTFLVNRDLIPIPGDRRTWTSLGFAGYWIIAAINTTPWTIGSTLLSLGLSVGQAMGIVVGTAIIIGLLAVGAGWPGSHQHIGFPVLERSSWGIRGAVWPVLNRVVTGSVWMGIQMYWGGQAVRIVLGAIIGPKFYYLNNTIPAASNVTTVEIISFFIFVLFLAPLLMIRPEHLQIPFRVAFIMITAVLIGMLIWSLAANGGAGPLLNTGQAASGSKLSWNALYGMQSFLGAYVSGTLGQSDWTRYAKTSHAAIIGQAVTAPITLILTSLFGILITSATQSLYGALFWNPFDLLLHIQGSMTASARAGTFFAGLGLLVNQAGVAIVLNSVACGMDLTNLLPKYINMRRGSYIVMLVGIATCPWNYVNQATTFLSVLSGWGVFLAPMNGVLFADYYIVRRRRLHMADLFIGNSTSAYWYLFGFNPRTVLSWAMGVWPLIPGFVRSIRGQNDYRGWDDLYNLNFFMGFLFSFTTHAVLHLAFPPAGAKGGSKVYEASTAGGGAGFGIRQDGILSRRNVNDHDDEYHKGGSGDRTADSSPEPKDLVHDSREVETV